METRRYIIVRHPVTKAEVDRVETTNCSWCTDEDFCGVCHDKAEAIRAELRATIAKATGGLNIVSFIP